MTRSNTRKTSAKKNENEQLEWERLFGPNIDHYMAMNRCMVLGRIFQHAGPQDVQDDDIWETTSPFIRTDLASIMSSHSSSALLQRIL